MIHKNAFYKSHISLLCKRNISGNSSNKTGLYIVDTGTKGNAEKIAAYIEKLGHQPKDLSTIISPTTTWITLAAPK